MGRALYYRSFVNPRGALWLSGVLIFVLMMATAFLGYVLPWGQMSYWGATVITNLFSVIPFIGDAFVHFLWGGYSVSNPTLNRFYSLHYLLPFILAVALVLHLALLHEHGSSSPVGYIDAIRFHPYFSIKDGITVILYMMVYIILVCWYPNILGHPDNNIEAAPLVTPLSIVPELTALVTVIRDWHKEQSVVRLLKHRLSLINDLVVDLPTPSNINYMWNFGSLLGVNFIVMLVSGIGLSM